MKAELDDVFRELTEPPHPALLPDIRSAIASGRRPRRKRSVWPSIVAVGLVPLLIAASVGGALWLKSHPPRVPTKAAAIALPAPVPQLITRTSAAAQVAWLVVRGQSSDELRGVDPAGRIVGPLRALPTQGLAGTYGVWRSGDGASLFIAGPDRLTSYSALDGSRLRTYSRLTGEVLGDGFSRDGHWLALLVLGQGLTVQLIDLGSGSTQEIAIPPGQAGGLSGAGYGTVFFGGDSQRLAALTGWGGPSRVTSLRLAGGKWNQALSITQASDGSALPTCNGPAMAGEIAGDMLVGFCHSDGALWFIDLLSPNRVEIVDTKQRNPFWLSPIFTPDGHLLYLHQWPGFGDAMQVVDLTTRKQLGPVPTPFDVQSNGPFGWLVTDVRAGGVASSVPISPDGLKLYSAGRKGVVELRVPDLKPLAVLAPGVDCSEVWVSGDGTTLFAMPSARGSVIVIKQDGGGTKTVTLPGDRYYSFLSSEHG